MKQIKYFVIILSLVFAGSLYAENDAAAKLKNYFNDVSIKVKQENDPAAKREILNTSLKKLDKIILKVSGSPGVPETDVIALNKLREDINDKYSELNGLNGYNKIKDNELNNFSNYLVQDMEQAANKYVIVSLITLLLIAILVLVLI